MLIAVDFFAPSDFAFRQGCEIASSLGSSPTVVHVAGGSGREVRLETEDGAVSMDRAGAQAFLEAHVQRKLDHFQKELGKGRFDVVACHLRFGDPASEIAQAAREARADVLVVGTHGRGPLQRLLVGSVAEKVVRLAPCAVYVAREREQRGAQSEGADHPS